MILKKLIDNRSWAVDRTPLRTVAERSCSLEAKPERRRREDRGAEGAERDRNAEGVEGEGNKEAWPMP